MAGGTFNKQNKIRPGVYQNIKTNKMRASESDINGVVAIALNLDFGKEEAITKIESETDIYNKLGYTLDDEKVLLLKEIMKVTSKILVFRLSGGEKAKATVDEDKTIIAKYAGTKGNEISVVITNNVEDETKYDVITYLSGVKVDSQTISKYEEFEENNYITITGKGAISKASTVNLTNGTTAQVTESTAYPKFLEALELENYNYIAYCGNDDATKALIVAFIRRMNDQEGIRVKAVMGEYSADYEKIITIKNGVVLEDGTVLTNAQCAAYFAALSACSDINVSNTYNQYQGAVDASPRLNNSDTEKALQKGNIVFTRKNDETVIIEQDINSLVTFTVEKNADFSKNRVVRAVDGLASDIKDIFERNYIGKLSNNEDGRNILRAAIINDIKNKVNKGAFQNFEEDDVIVKQGSNIDSVLIDVAIQPVDSIEKIYMNVEVQ